RATGETPFFLVYGAEACLSPEIHLGSPWVQAFDESMQEQLRRDDVDFVDERRWRAAIRNACYNQALSSTVRAQYGAPGWRPRLEADPEPSRAPQTLPQLGGSLQHYRSM